MGGKLSIDFGYVANTIYFYIPPLRVANTLMFKRHSANSGFLVLLF